MPKCKDYSTNDDFYQTCVSLISKYKGKYSLNSRSDTEIASYIDGVNEYYRRPNVDINLLMREQRGKLNNIWNEYFEGVSVDDDIKIKCIEAEGLDFTYHDPDFLY